MAAAPVTAPTPRLVPAVVEEEDDEDEESGSSEEEEEGAEPRPPHTLRPSQLRALRGCYEDDELLRTTSDPELLLQPKESRDEWRELPAHQQYWLFMRKVAEVEVAKRRQQRLGRRRNVATSQSTAKSLT